MAMLRCPRKSRPCWRIRLMQARFATRPQPLDARSGTALLLARPRSNDNDGLNLTRLAVQQARLSIRSLRS